MASPLPRSHRRAYANYVHVSKRAQLYILRCAGNVHCLNAEHDDVSIPCFFLSGGSGSALVGLRFRGIRCLSHFPFWRLVRFTPFFHSAFLSSFILFYKCFEKPAGGSSFSQYYRLLSCERAVAGCKCSFLLREITGLVTSTCRNELPGLELPSRPIMGTSRLHPSSCSVSFIFVCSTESRNTNPRCNDVLGSGIRLLYKRYFSKSANDVLFIHCSFDPETLRIKRGLE